MRTIKFPDMRMNVLDNLQSLSDADHQMKTWINHEAYDSFDEVVHCLFDDSGFEKEPRSAIGDLLFEEEEADRIKAVIVSIDALFEKYGKNLSDAGYMATPEWPAIMAGARNALHAMKRGDLRYMEPAQRQELYGKYGFES
jgi:hypothetical protein